MLDADIQRLLETVFAASPDPAAPDVAALRAAALSAPLTLGAPPEPVAEVRDVRASSAARAAIPARLYHPQPGVAVPLLVFAHGGGWVTGSLDSHDRVCRMLANRLGSAVLAIDYRCAPEHRFPAALDDVDGVWHWVREEARALSIDPGRLAVGGDSSGGNLAAALTLRLRARREAQPVLQLLLYPALDARAASRSYEAFAVGYNLSAGMMRWYWRAYAPGADPAEPCVSPLAAPDLAGLAPAVVAVAQADVLRDEALEYANRLASAGVPTTVVDCDGMIHGFLRWSGAVPAATRWIDRICAAARPLLA